MSPFIDLDVHVYETEQAWDYVKDGCQRYEQKRSSSMGLARDLLSISRPGNSS